MKREECEIKMQHSNNHSQLRCEWSEYDLQSKYMLNLPLKYISQ